MSGTGYVTGETLADLIEQVVSSFYNDGTETGLVALERLAEALRTPCTCGFGGFHDDVNERCERNAQ